MDVITGFFLEQLQALKGNEFFHGGMVLGILSALALWGRRIPALLLSILRRRLVVEVEIRKTCYAYTSLLAWWSRQPGSGRNRRFVAKNGKDSALGVAQEVPPDIDFYAAPGNHFLWNGGRPLWLSLKREKVKNEEGLLLAYHEELHLRSVGRDRRHMLDMLRKIVSEYWHLKTTSKVFIPNQSFDFWDQLEGIVPGRLDTVFLPAGQLEKIRDDMSDFLSRQEWFRSKGIPWRRGYLFHGPPGTGKSKLCMSLCGHFRLSLAVVNLAHPKLSDSSLAGMLTEAPLGSVFLFEDIDRVVGSQRNDLTMAGLLNVLDGVVALDGRIVFMTTNNLSQLDPALIRPGRIDLQEYLGFVTPEQAQRYFRHFFPGAPDRAPAFAQWAGNGKWTMAQLQGHLVSHMEDLEAASCPPSRLLRTDGNGSTALAGLFINGNLNRNEGAGHDALARG